MKKWMIALVLCIAAFGCKTTKDPVTGEKRYSVDPNDAAVVEAVVEGGAALAPLFGPIGTAIGGLLLGGLGVWRKVKPDLVKERTKAEHYHATAAATVTALEEFKNASPEEWLRVKKLVEAQLLKQGVDPLVIENIIRGLRGLPPKS